MRRRSKLVCMLVAGLAVLGIISPVGAATFAIIARGAAFEPEQMSADGSILVGGVYPYPNDDPRAAVWTRSAGLSYLPSFGGNGNVALAVSADGSTIVGTGDIEYRSILSDGTAWRWTAAGGYQSIIAPGFSNSYATSISADGNTVGISAWDANSLSGQAYLWNTSDGLSALPATSSGQVPDSVIISPDAKTAIGDTFHSKGYIWTNSTGSQNIPTLELPFMGPQVMTPDGHIVYGIAYTRGPLTVIFRYSDGISTNLGPPSSLTVLTSSIAGTTANGQMLVGNATLSGSNDYQKICWAWTPGNGFEPLEGLLTADGFDIAGYNIEHVSGISPDGNVLYGYGSEEEGPNGGVIPSAWIAYVPEPIALMLNIPLIAIACSRHSRQRERSV